MTCLVQFQAALNDFRSPFIPCLSSFDHSIHWDRYQSPIPPHPSPLLPDASPPLSAALSTLLCFPSRRLVIFLLACASDMRSPLFVSEFLLFFFLTFFLFVISALALRSSRTSLRCGLRCRAHFRRGRGRRQTRAMDDMFLNGGEIDLIQ